MANWLRYFLNFVSWISPILHILPMYNKFCLVNLRCRISTKEAVKVSRANDVVNQDINVVLLLNDTKNTSNHEASFSEVFIGAAHYDDSLETRWWSYEEERIFPMKLHVRACAIKKIAPVTMKYISFARTWILRCTDKQLPRWIEKLTQTLRISHLINDASSSEFLWIKTSSTRRGRKRKLTQLLYATLVQY